MSHTDSQVSFQRKRNDDLSFYAESTAWYDSIKLYLKLVTYSRIHGGKAVAFPSGPLEFVELTEETNVGLLPEPFMEISQDEASALMSALWNMGIRPAKTLMSQGSIGEEGELEAIKFHLRDMRHIAFKGKEPGGND